jgi:hypothetical protein
VSTELEAAVSALWSVIRYHVVTEAQPVIWRNEVKPAESGDALDSCCGTHRFRAHVEDLEAVVPE